MELTNQPGTESQASFSVEKARQARRIETFVSNYSADVKGLTYPERVRYKKGLRDVLGVSSERMEIRMKDLFHRDGSFNEDEIRIYEDELRAGKEAGLAAPNIALFTPDEWMKKLLKTSPERFQDMFKVYTTKVAEMCKSAGVRPARFQVMSEVNTNFQIKIAPEIVINLINDTSEIFRKEFPVSESEPKVKIMTTISTVNNWNWKKYAEKLLSSPAGVSLDTVGFDYYPTLENLAGMPIPIIGKKGFASTNRYEWIAEQKLSGILKEKEVVLAEIGAPELIAGSEMQRFGYDRIIQTLDHFFLKYEKRGIPAHDIISSIGFFMAADWPQVVSYVPGGPDVHPWALIHRNKSGAWELTSGGQVLKKLIDTRLNPALNPKANP
jgi:hypothetical protein